MTASSSRPFGLLPLLEGRRDWLGSDLADRREASRRTKKDGDASLTSAREAG